MQALSQYIRSYFFVPDESIQQMQGEFVQQILPKGAFFLKQGQSSDYLSFIHEGLLRIYRQTGNKEVTQWISTPGSLVTDLASFVFDQPARWNIQALTDCKLATISRTQYENLDKIIPHWKEIDRRFMAKCFVMLEERVFTHLHMTAEERFKQLMDYQPDLFNEVPLQYLASMMGMSAETLSRLRAK
jgi:CRP-like cAMP-binding protein